MTDDQIVHVVGAIIERDGAVFVARRNPGRSAGGRWEFPGGKVELGETPEQALARELREELAIDVAVGPLMERSTANVAGTIIELSCYEVSLLGPEPVASTDHNELSWVPVARLGELAWTSADTPIVEQMVRSHRSIGFSPKSRH